MIHLAKHGADFLVGALARINEAERAARRKLVECDYLGIERANAWANDVARMTNEELDRRIAQSDADWARLVAEMEGELGA